MARYVDGFVLPVPKAKLAADQVAVHFFSKRAAEGEIIHECRSPIMDPSGRLSEWPEGLFDRQEVALERLL